MNRKHLTVYLLLLTLLTAACAPGATEEPVTETIAEEPAAAPTEAPAAFAGEAEVPVEVPAGESVAGTPGGDFALLSHVPQAAAAADRLVIKDGNMELLVRDTDAAINRVTQLTADYGGYILSSETWYEHDFKHASITLALPSNEFERALQRLRSIGLQVISETASGQDVSAEFIDLEARLTNLEATAGRIRSFLEQAKNVEESLRISGQLSEVEAEINQVRGQINFYQGRAAFSTITVLITPQFPTPTPPFTRTPTPTFTPTPTLTPTPAWSPGRTFEQASEVTTGIAKFGVDIIIWAVIVLGPFVLAGGVIAAIIRGILQRTKK